MRSIDAGAALVAALLGAAAPAAAQHYDGIDNDNNGVIDDPGEHGGGGLGSDRLETECMTTGRLDVCVAYHQFACQTWGFPLACQMAQMGQNCYGGDPGQCQYYQQVIQANTACAYGDPNACNWLRMQGF